MTKPMPRVAYYCMEFGLSEHLNLYAGGLGVLAGDLLKAAHDRNMPLVGIGILWDEGYSVQTIGPDGQPRDAYLPLRRGRLEPVDARFSVHVRGGEVPLRAWRVTAFGNAPLFLIEPERDEHRWITARLYQGGFEARIAQEIVLGVGGVRLLRALGLEVDVHHFNEGHAVLAGLELMREAMVAGASFEEARQRARTRIAFTTHTPVVAGNEAHHVDALLAQGAGLGLFGPEQLVEIAGDPFTMTVAGLRLARAANAVSELHGETSRRMWRHVPDAAPITAITNGVHVPTWQDPRMAAALRGDGDPWHVHLELKRELIAEIECRTGHAFAPDRLLVGFARRIVPYKRPDLVFRDLAAVGPLLAAGRLQLVFAGKTHPEHAEAKGLVSHVVSLARQFPRSVAFLEDYDMRLGRLLTRGCDVWLNNPVRPLEASGTSGMKAALNGVLNLSVLDGWWPEACRHGENGWEFGGGYEGPGQTEHDLASLVRVLTREVVPAWEGPRERWVAMMKASAETARERFSADRMLSDYLRLLYAVS